MCDKGEAVLTEGVALELDSLGGNELLDGVIREVHEPLSQFSVFCAKLSAEHSMVGCEGVFHVLGVVRGEMDLGDVSLRPDILLNTLHLLEGLLFEADHSEGL